MVVTVSLELFSVQLGLFLFSQSGIFVCLFTWYLFLEAIDFHGCTNGISVCFLSSHELMFLFQKELWFWWIILPFLQWWICPFPRSVSLVRLSRDTPVIAVSSQGGFFEKNPQEDTEPIYICRVQGSQPLSPCTPFVWYCFCI